jgi:ATP-binding cassette subfamily F protein 3
VGREERIALVGPNGAGKSSLLKLLAGELEPEEGVRRAGPATRTAYFAQHQTEQLNPNLTVLEELMTVSGQASQTAMRTLLGAFLFSGDEVGKKVSVLSGGERSRLVLAKLLYSGANLLLLDEPTNHLDIPSRAALESALDKWPGAIVLVTHDRLLIDAVSNRIWEISPGEGNRSGAGLRVYPGNLQDYLTTWKRLEKEPQEKTAEERDGTDRKGTKAESGPGGRRSKARRREEAEARRLVSRRTKGLRLRLDELEDRAARKEAELEELNNRLSQPQIYNQPEEAARLSRLAARVREELEGLGEDWSRAALELEEAAASAQTE